VVAATENCIVFHFSATAVAGSLSAIVSGVRNIKRFMKEKELMYLEK
jgi:hypothetical protein